MPRARPNILKKIKTFSGVKFMEKTHTQSFLDHLSLKIKKLPPIKMKIKET